MPLDEIAGVIARARGPIRRRAIAVALLAAAAALGSLLVYAGYKRISRRLPRRRYRKRSASSCSNESPSQRETLSAANDIL
jgi:hypothetical protein